MRIDPKSPVPINAQVVDGIKRQVLQGHYSPGEMLPSVRALAGTLAINPNTVMRAYQMLEFAGIISTRRGKGVYLTEKAPALCRREFGTADLHRLDELVARLLAQQVPPATVLNRVQQALQRHTMEQAI
jgi:GntR family transcriptional regulator